MFNYKEIFEIDKQKGYMKFIIGSGEYNNLKHELDKNFMNHELDIVIEKEGMTVIVGTIGVEYIGS